MKGQPAGGIESEGRCFWLPSPLHGERIHERAFAMGAREPKRLLSRPPGTLSAAPIGGEGRGEEALIISRPLAPYPALRFMERD